MWIHQAKVWRPDIAVTAITLLELRNVDEPLTELFQNFFERSPPLNRQIFYMQGKAQKGKSIHQISWPSRAITAVSSWFTTPPLFFTEHIGENIFAL